MNSPKFVAYPTAPEDEPVYLHLSISNGSHVILEVVDKDGNWHRGGNLLSLTKDGLKLPTHVDPKLGIALDENGRVVVGHDI